LVGFEIMVEMKGYRMLSKCESIVFPIVYAIALVVIVLDLMVWRPY
jgi:Na+-transporting methylmalonyl-CoA/oxaloacetate decarboxylase beta subunit